MSDYWTGFTRFTLLKEDPDKGHMWSGGRLTKVQTTTRTDHEKPEVWTNNTKAAQKRERQEWANKKPKLENARRMRGIYFIDREDKEKTTDKCEKKSWNCRWKPAAQEKNARKLQRGLVQPTRFQGQRTLESWNLMNPQDKRMEPTLQKGDSMNHFNVVHKFIPMQQQAVNIPDAKAAVEKEWEKSSKRSKLGSWIRSRAKRKVLWQHEETQAKSTLPH